MKKVLKAMTLFVAMALTACGGATANNSDKSGEPAGGSNSGNASTSAASASSQASAHVHTFDTTRWESNETQHWHPATCEHTSQKGDRANHEFEDFSDADHVNKVATCSEPGVKYEKCRVCNYIKETILTADHDMQDYAYDHEKAADEVASTMKKCSRDNYYELAFSAVDSAAQLNNTSDKKSGGWVKLSSQVASDGTGTASYVIYKFYSPLALTGRFWIDITGNTSSHWTRSDESGSQSLYYTYNDTTTKINTWKNKVEFGTDVDNLAEVDFENAKYNIDGQDIAFKALEFEDFGTLESSSSQSGAGKTISVPMPEMTLNAGVNILKFTRLTGYAFNFHNFTFKSNIVAAEQQCLD